MGIPLRKKKEKKRKEIAGKVRVALTTDRALVRPRSRHSCYSLSLPTRSCPRLLPSPGLRPSPVVPPPSHLFLFSFLRLVRLFAASASSPAQHPLSSPHMAAVNLQTISSNVPFDFLPLSHPHSRSNSISSSHSPHSRPHSSQDIVPRMPPGLPSPADDPYRLSSAYLSGDQVRHPSVYSLPSADMSPCQSPPNSNMTNPALKGHIRQSHLRARAAASPYPRDTESVHSSSSETDDLSMFLGTPDYSTMYGHGQPMPANHQEPRQPPGVFGRVSISPDHALQKLAANVRVATTTSASDRAKQIFVQAWSVPFISFPCSPSHTNAYF